MQTKHFIQGLHGAAQPLAQQQNASGCLQSGRTGRGAGWHNGHRERRQRWEFLRRTAKLHGGDEEPGGEIQWSAVRRAERAR